MDVQRYRRHDRPRVKYVAHCVGGLLDPSPYWFQELVAKGLMKDDGDCLKVKTITGVWQPVPQGTWVVYQENGYVWEMDSAAFNQLFYEV